MDIKQISGVLGLIGTVAVGVWAIESRYASAEDVAKHLQEKAEKKEVIELQKEILQDRLIEIEYEQFILERQGQRNELEEFRLQQLKQRSQQIQLKLVD